jgi:NADPH-dependent F420 reductase
VDITIIGTGNMARAIATRALAGGHEVTLLGTSREEADELAGELSGDVRAGEVGDALTGDMVVLAVWSDAVPDVIDRYGDQLDGKVLVDITNPIDTERFEPLVFDAGSEAQQTAAAAPGARVVKAFNTTFAGTLPQGEVKGQPLDVLLASDDEDAKRVVSELAQSMELRPVDAGPLRRARELEALGYLHMALQDSLGTGYGSAVKFLG